VKEVLVKNRRLMSAINAIENGDGQEKELID